LPEVAGGGLQSVENQAGGFVFNVPGEQQADDLHDRDLDGISVLEHGKVDGRNRLCCFRKSDVLLVPSSMKVAKPVVANGRRSALSAIDLDVFAAVDFGVIEQH
jgi:hypothetical protein